MTFIQNQKFLFDYKKPHRGNFSLYLKVPFSKWSVQYFPGTNLSICMTRREVKKTQVRKNIYRFNREIFSCLKSFQSYSIKSFKTQKPRWGGFPFTYFLFANSLPTAHISLMGCGILVPYKFMHFFIPFSFRLKDEKLFRGKLTSVFCNKFYNTETYHQTQNSTYFINWGGLNMTIKNLAGAVKFKINKTNSSRLAKRDIFRTYSLKGILLVNFPEKEKNFLTKNLAAENKIPLITQSASLLLKDSRNMDDLLGVDDPIQILFDKVKTYIPCICFINNLDSIGKQRYEQKQKSLDWLNHSFSLLIHNNLLGQDAFETVNNQKPYIDFQTEIKPKNTGRFSTGFGYIPNAWPRNVDNPLVPWGLQSSSSLRFNMLATLWNDRQRLTSESELYDPKEKVGSSYRSQQRLSDVSLGEKRRRPNNLAILLSRSSFSRFSFKNEFPHGHGIPVYIQNQSAIARRLIRGGFFKHGLMTNYYHRLPGWLSKITPVFYGRVQSRHKTNIEKAKRFGFYSRIYSEILINTYSPKDGIRIIPKNSRRDSNSDFTYNFTLNKTSAYGAALTLEPKDINSRIFHYWGDNTSRLWFNPWNQKFGGINQNWEACFLKKKTNLKYKHLVSLLFGHQPWISLFEERGNAAVNFGHEFTGALMALKKGLSKYPYSISNKIWWRSPFRSIKEEVLLKDHLHTHDLKTISKVPFFKQTDFGFGDQTKKGVAPRDNFRLGFKVSNLNQIKRSAETEQMYKWLKPNNEINRFFLAPVFLERKKHGRVFYLNDQTKAKDALNSNRPNVTFKIRKSLIRHRLSFQGGREQGIASFSIPSYGEVPNQKKSTTSKLLTDTEIEQTKNNSLKITETDIIKRTALLKFLQILDGFHTSTETKKPRRGRVFPYLNLVTLKNFNLSEIFFTLSKTIKPKSSSVFLNKPKNTEASKKPLPSSTKANATSIAKPSFGYPFRHFLSFQALPRVSGTYSRVRHFFPFHSKRSDGAGHKGLQASLGFLCTSKSLAKIGWDPGGYKHIQVSFVLAESSPTKRWGGTKKVASISRRNFPCTSENEIWRIDEAGPKWVASGESQAYPYQAINLYPEDFVSGGIWSKRSDGFNLPDNWAKFKINNKHGLANKNLIVPFTTVALPKLQARSEPRQKNVNTRMRNLLGVPNNKWFPSDTFKAWTKLPKINPLQFNKKIATLPMKAEWWIRRLIRGDLNLNQTRSTEFLQVFSENLSGVDYQNSLFGHYIPIMAKKNHGAPLESSIIRLKKLPETKKDDIYSKIIMSKFIDSSYINSISQKKVGSHFWLPNFSLANINKNYTPAKYKSSKPIKEPALKNPAGAILGVNRFVLAFEYVLQKQGISKWETYLKNQPLSKSLNLLCVWPSYIEDILGPFNLNDSGSYILPEYFQLLSHGPKLKKQGITLIASTNNLTTLDAALLRPGRFDTIINFSPPAGFLFINKSVKMLKHSPLLIQESVLSWYKIYTKEKKQPPLRGYYSRFSKPTTFVNMATALPQKSIYHGRFAEENSAPAEVFWAIKNQFYSQVVTVDISSQFSSIKTFIDVSIFIQYKLWWGLKNSARAESLWFPLNKKGLIQKPRRDESTPLLRGFFSEAAVLLFLRSKIYEIKDLTYRFIKMLQMLCFRFFYRHQVLQFSMIFKTKLKNQTKFTSETVIKQSFNGINALAQNVLISKAVALQLPKKPRRSDLLNSFLEIYFVPNNRSYRLDNYESKTGSLAESQYKNFGYNLYPEHNNVFLKANRRLLFCTGDFNYKVDTEKDSEILLMKQQPWKKKQPFWHLSSGSTYDSKETLLSSKGGGLRENKMYEATVWNLQAESLKQALSASFGNNTIDKRRVRIFNKIKNTNANAFQNGRVRSRAKKNHVRLTKYNQIYHRCAVKKIKLKQQSFFNLHPFSSLIVKRSLEITKSNKLNRYLVMPLADNILPQPPDGFSLYQQKQQRSGGNLLAVFQNPWLLDLNGKLPSIQIYNNLDSATLLMPRSISLLKKEPAIDGVRGGKKPPGGTDSFFSIYESYLFKKLSTHSSLNIACLQIYSTLTKPCDMKKETGSLPYNEISVGFQCFNNTRVLFNGRVRSHAKKWTSSINLLEIQHQLKKIPRRITFSHQNHNFQNTCKVKSLNERINRLTNKYNVLLLKNPGKSKEFLISDAACREKEAYRPPPFFFKAIDTQNHRWPNNHPPGHQIDEVMRWNPNVKKEHNLVKTRELFFENPAGAEMCRLDVSFFLLTFYTMFFEKPRRSEDKKTTLNTIKIFMPYKSLLFSHFLLCQGDTYGFSCKNFEILVYNKFKNFF